MTGPDPKSAERFDPELFMSYVRNVGHGGAIGIAYLGHGEDWAELSLPYDERLIGMATSGIIASGPIISLMDMATSLAIWIKLGRFRPQATLDLRNQLSSNRTQGIPNMIALVRETAARLAA